MIRFPVSPRKAEDLRRRMSALGISEADLRETFFCPNRGRVRKGGAQVGVNLAHVDSRTHLRCQKSTSQALNRFLVRRQLVRQLEAKQAEAESAPTVAAAEVGELPIQHMFRMFTKSFERDVAQPFPHSASKLTGVAAYSRRLIGVMGEPNPKERVRR